MTAAPRVLVADDLSPAGLGILRDAGLEVVVRTGLGADALAAALAGFHALVVRSATKVTAAALGGADALRVIGRAGIGVDNIDVQAASRRGIVVMNTPAGNAVTTAEHAIALLCALARHVPQATASVKSGRWEKGRFRGVELCDKTLGIVGLGNIGRIVADRARGLHMRVIACDPFLSEDAAAGLGLTLATLDDLLARADFVTLHTPLTPETRGMIGAAALARMKPGALLVNAARGGIVDEAALLDALRSGRIAGAALDVFSTEPPAGSPLLALENVICTPHLGASTEEAQEKVAAEVAHQVAAFLLRGEVRNAVNAPSLPSEDRERLAPYLDLAARLGAFVGQLCGAALAEVEVEISGRTLEAAAGPLAAAALAGLLRTHMDVPVNEVNAALLAAERGVRVAETRRSGDERAPSVAVKAGGRGWSRRARGSLFEVGDGVEPRVVAVDDLSLEARLSTHMLLLRNADRPGVIGAVGTVLGSRGINVSGLHVGLARDRSDAVEIWNLDSEPGDAVVDEIRRLPHMRSVTRLAI